MTPRAIPELERSLAGLRVEPLRAAMDSLLALATDDDVAAVLTRLYKSSVTGVGIDGDAVTALA